MKIIKSKNMKWWIGIVACMALFAIIGSFAYMKMNFLIRGVKITATIEKTTDSSLIKVVGNAKNATYLTLNGREIYIDQNGYFNESVALLPGLGVVTLETQDKLGRRSQKKIEVMYQESIGKVAFNESKIINN